jgi:catechol 2,3-dioxygenase-like lactoylglutathione lyase family enzyme
MTTPFLGLRTAMYHVSDLARAKAWYTDVLGFGPYFDEPFYVGFEVAGYELGLNPDMTHVTPGGSTYVYWGVEDAAAAYQRLLSLGATAHEPVNEVGGGILVGTVKDPWDNVLGVIQNPHFKLA